MDLVLYVSPFLCRYGFVFCERARIFRALRQKSQESLCDITTHPFFWKMWIYFRNSVTSRHIQKSDKIWLQSGNSLHCALQMPRLLQAFSQRRLTFLACKQHGMPSLSQCTHRIRGRIRLFSVVRYESVIHEYDPYFNYRATAFLVNRGFYEFINWVDSRTWYVFVHLHFVYSFVPFVLSHHFAPGTL
jgi:hypothetical protein